MRGVQLHRLDCCLRVDSRLEETLVVKHTGSTGKQRMLNKSMEPSGMLKEDGPCDSCGKEEYQTANSALTEANCEFACHGKCVSLLTPCCSYEFARPRIDTMLMNAISGDRGRNPGVEDRNSVAEKNGPSFGAPASKLAWVDGRRNRMSLSRISIGRWEPQARNLSRT